MTDFDGGAIIETTSELILESIRTSSINQKQVLEGLKWNF